MSRRRECARCRAARTAKRPGATCRCRVCGDDVCRHYAGAKSPDMKTGTCTSCMTRDAERRQGTR